MERQTLLIGLIIGMVIGSIITFSMMSERMWKMERAIDHLSKGSYHLLQSYRYAVVYQNYKEAESQLDIAIEEFTEAERLLTELGLRD